jgi:hypothetical protein
MCGCRLRGTSWADDILRIGDGRAEYLDVSPSSAAVKAWFNGCSQAPTGGSGPIQQPDPTQQPDPITQPVPTKLPDSIGGAGDHASCNDLKGRWCSVYHEPLLTPGSLPNRQSWDPGVIVLG